MESNGSAARGQIELTPLNYAVALVTAMTTTQALAVRRHNDGKKRGQPFRITQSQLREVVIQIGFSASNIKLH